MHRNKVEQWFPWPEGRGNGELLFNEYKVAVLQDGKSSGDGGWHRLHNVMNVFNTTQLYT